MYDVDVLIVGAGPTGLTLAVDLARLGVPHRIVERSGGPGTASKAKTIQPRAMEVLDDLGAVAPVLARGVVDLPTRFHDPSGVTVDKPSMSVRAGEVFNSPYPDPVWIGQFDVEAALRDRLTQLGGAVEFGVEAFAVEQDTEGVTLSVHAGGHDTRIRARYLVAADGGRSTVRGLVGLSLTGQTYENQRWYLGDVTAPGLDRKYLHIWTSERGMLGLTPLPGSDLWQLQSPIRPDEKPSEPSLRLYQSMFDERAGAGTVTLTSANWLSVFRVNVRMVDQYRAGRVFLAGDAAHVHSPAGGQGMNTGIQDAYNLGWKLAAVLRGANDALLDTYGEERIPVARAVLADSTGKMRQTTAAVTGRSDQGLSAALGSIADDITTGLPVGYPNSSLTLPLTGDTNRPVRPGDRAPDVTTLRDTTGPVSLFDLLRGTHWTLLAFENPQALMFDQADPAHVHVHRITRGPGGTLTDPEGEFQRRYQPRDRELILVRPDGYVAARVPATDETAISDHLARLRPDGNHL
ncbi:FAD-dependent monooxygenase [Actinoplanes philippinensis]|uniref:FAD-dependent monooxygenase n=1 Tax=Actinoplanes philippinensis TaxID=35752 RepID=UPI0033D0961A